MNILRLVLKEVYFMALELAGNSTKESFWDKAGLNKVFSSFRLSGSYGKVGNVAGIGDFSPTRYMAPVCMAVLLLWYILRLVLLLYNGKPVKRPTSVLGTAYLTTD